MYSQLYNQIKHCEIAENRIIHALELLFTRNLYTNVVYRSADL